jgi:uncharacterized alkaline shock family protein YloU
MNTFNRVVMILLLLATMLVMTVVLVVPRPIIVVVQGWLQNLDANLALVTQPLLLIIGVILALLVDVICAALIWLEVRRKRPSGIRVQRISGGYAELAVDSIARRLEYSLTQLADVISVKPEVFGRWGGVEVDLDLETSPDVDVPAKTEEIYQVTKEAIEDKMGLKLRRVRVNIKHAPYPTERQIAPRQIASPTGGQAVSE